ncbi:MAG TPA: molybdopterin-synthase adenylyltransferase MoeB [Oceanospirillaceae bacterium]|nr:molybdopterin-synthase adenylyltransferase MoeB [Oceanospirillaceae bacterium]
MNDQQLNRYSRQIMLPEFDYQGQQDLLNARVLIIGLGGLGSPVALYLAAAGVGTLVLADDDVVDDSNLQRQIIHAEANVGEAKVASAQQSIAAINSGVEVVALTQRLEAQALSEQVAAADLVVDCCDNLVTRLAVNKACLEQVTPLVSGAAIRMEGQVIVVDPRQTDMPCYHCLMQLTGPQDSRCSSNGVMAPVVGIVGAVQAMEAIKVIAKLGQPLLGKLLLLDAKTMQWQQFSLPKDATCPSCGNE